MPIDWDNLTWTCMICGNRRPDAKISVWKTDLSEQYGLPPGHVTQNVRYCNDREACVKAAPHKKLGPLPKYDRD